MAELSYRLIFLSGDRIGESVPLSKDELTLGRSRTNDIVVSDPAISRKHIRFVVRNDCVEVEDLNTSHGSFVNEAPIKNLVRLNHGDVVRAGQLKMRFEGQLDERPEDVTHFMDQKAVAEMVSKGTATGAKLDTGSATRAMPVQKAKAEHPVDETRVFEAERTRMLEVSELRDLQPGGKPAPSRRRILLGMILCVLVISAAAVIVSKQRLPSTSLTTGMASGGVAFTDAQYGFSLSIPQGWVRAKDDPNAILSFRGDDPAQGMSAFLKVYIDRSGSYEVTALTATFEESKPVWNARYQEFKLLGNDHLTINEAKIVFYAFAASQKKGKGILTLSGDKRIFIECYTAPAHYPELASLFTDILSSFRLNEEQRVIDFPLPTDEIRQLAAVDPNRLEQDAQVRLELGRDLLKRKEVRPENLYYAVVEFKLCLQRLYALTTKPAFYNEAAQELEQATTLFDRGVREQKFKIIMAAKQKDWRTARYESTRLLQMVPDKTDGLYQYALKRMKQYEKKE